MTAPNKPERKDWLNAKIQNQAYKEIPYFKKKKIIRQGKKDAKRAVISFDETGVVHSDYCNELVENANRKVELVWRNCQSDLQNYKPYLDFQQNYFDDTLVEYLELLQEREAIIEEVKNTKMPGDDEMSQGTVRARISKRIKDNTAEVDAKISEFKQTLDSITTETKAVLTDFEARELIAESDEETIIHGVQEMLSIYLQGTWRLIDSRPFDIKTPKLTGLPKSRHYNNYPRYCFSIKKRSTSKDFRGEN